MFLATILSIITLSVVVEWLIVRYYLKNRSQRVKQLYKAAAALCIAPYTLLLIAGRIWDLFSATSAKLSNIFIIVLLLNFIWKSMWLVGTWLGQKHQRRWPRILTLTLAALLTLLYTYGSLWERNQLRTTQLTLCYPNLPAEADGLRIVQIGDLHLGLGDERERRLTRIVDEINAQQPDILIDCGDMVNSRYFELDSLAQEILGRVKAPLGVYTTIGNHDNGHYVIDTVALPPERNIATLIERQRSIGWQNIVDSHIGIPFGSDTIYLSAIDYPKSLAKGSHGAKPTENYGTFFAALPSEAFNIVISHTPTAWDNILAATKAELTLSGHVHSMQLRVPIGKRGWSPAALIYDRWSGLYTEDGCALHITDGLGSNPKVRIGVKPQIVVITLRKS